MQLSLQDLGTIARDFLGKMETEGISTLEDLEERVGDHMIVHEGQEDYLFLEVRPSEHGTETLTLSYIRPGTGIPVEIKLNRMVGYAHIILKAQDIVPGYAPFAGDPYDNIIQAKKLRPLRFDDVITELRELGTGA